MDTEIKEYIEYNMKTDKSSTIELPAASIPQINNLICMIYQSDTTEDMINSINDDSYFKKLPEEEMLKLLSEAGTLRRLKSKDFNASRLEDKLHIKIGLYEMDKILKNEVQATEKAFEVYISLRNALKSL